MNDFAQPELAEEAMYTYSKGGTEVSGLSIRAAECIATRWGNMQTDVRILERYDDASLMQARAIDLQTGTSRSMTFHVAHRRDTKRGSYEITDEREIYELGANLAARRLRACIFSLIPISILKEAQKQAESTLKTRAEVTPQKLKTMLEKFAEHGVTQGAIERRIQRKLEAIAPAQVVQMQKIFTSLRDGMSKPSDWFELEEQSEPQRHSNPPRGAEGPRRVRRESSPPQSNAPATDGESVGTGTHLAYAAVRARLEAATTLDELGDAYKLIAGSEPAHLRGELTDIAEQQQVKLAAKGGTHEE
jgi:hypothetical protein